MPSRWVGGSLELRGEVNFGDNIWIMLKAMEWAHLLSVGRERDQSLSLGGVQHWGVEKNSHRKLRKGLGQEENHEGVGSGDKSASQKEVWPTVHRFWEVRQGTIQLAQRQSFSQLCFLIVLYLYLSHCNSQLLHRLVIPVFSPLTEVP